MLHKHQIHLRRLKLLRLAMRFVKVIATTQWVDQSPDKLSFQQKKSFANNAGSLSLRCLCLNCRNGTISMTTAGEDDL